MLTDSFVLAAGLDAIILRKITAVVRRLSTGRPRSEPRRTGIALAEGL
jgi:hypothetical protein